MQKNILNMLNSGGSRQRTAAARQHQSEREFTMKNFLYLPIAATVAAFSCSPALAQEVCDVGGAPSGTATGPFSLACGDLSSASGHGSTAIGNDAEASGHVAVAIGYGSNASASYSTAVGSFSDAVGEYSTAIGYAANAAGVQSTAIGLASEAVGYSSTAVGFNAAAGGEYSTAIGEGADATGLQSTAIGGATSTGGFTNSVALGYGTTNTADSQVAVGGRTVTQLANATLNATSTDAVTGQQLFATNQTIATQGVAIADLQISDTVQTSQIAGLDTRVTALETLSGNLGALQGSVDQLFDLRHRDRRDMKQGVAAAMAMADAPMPSRPGGVSYQVKAGTFRGEHAISGALTYRLNTSSPMAVSAGVSHAGNKNTGANIAFSGEF